MEGWRLRCMIMATRTVQARYNAQRRTLGLPEVDYAALALETAQLDPQLLDMVADADAEFVVEPEQLLDDVAVPDGNVEAVKTNSQASFAEKVEEAKTMH